MLGTSFRNYERQIREQFSDMFARAGLNTGRDIAGIILNRWGHAYLSPQPGFFFGQDGRPAPREILRRAPFGRTATPSASLPSISVMAFMLPYRWGQIPPSLVPARQPSRLLRKSLAESRLMSI